MNYRDKIISDIADGKCKKISRKVVRGLQKITEDMQSGDDTPLKNIWDEICVQVQGEESVMWEAYLNTIRSFIQAEVKKLDARTKQAIWLQTNEGLDWAIDNEEQETVSFFEDDIIDNILQDYVLSEAADWTNKRIEKYLEREFD
jgi:hypothetical protein